MRADRLLLVVIPILLLVAVPVSGGDMAGEGPVLLRGPYLTPADGSALTVHIWTDRPVETVVEFGKEEDVLRRGSYSRAVSSPAVLEHQRILLTDLAPATRYQYRVRYGGASTGDLHFLTCPAAGPVTFLVMGDSRDQPPVYLMEERFGGVASRAAAEQGVHFLVHTGDFVLDGDSGGDWDRFFRIGGVLLGNATLLPAGGNHDGSREGFTDLFALPLNYTFSCGDVQVVVLDSGDNSWRDLPAQARWLDRALAAGPPLKVAALHYPLVSSDEGHMGGWANLREVFLPVLSRHGVLAVFQGHVHLYERDVSEGIQFITEARAGAPPYSFGPERAADFRAGVEGTLGYTRVTTGPAGSSAVAEVIRVAGSREKGESFPAPGSILERVMLP
ncbi:MAG: metallophosphoesterase, partial [Methanomicrobiales archaeon]|nr:metallophosphoesterase [Methanomicrobiales archaeon]